MVFVGGKIYVRQTVYLGTLSILVARFFRTADGQKQKTMFWSLEFLTEVRSSSDCDFDFKLI